jgi:Transport protein Trs120 or TRAPPC9, TRAPP II complex subunit
MQYHSKSEVNFRASENEIYTNDGLRSYNQAIEICKGTADFLWLASAMEGQICAMLLLEYLHADVGVNMFTVCST